MKKILFASFALVLLALNVSAQIPVRTKHTVAAADTITLSNVGSKVVGLQASYVESNGTSAGKFYIQGTLDGITWKHVDSSFTVTDVATAQAVIVAISTTTYKDYRCIFSNTSSASGSFYFTALRRPDDR
jgi:hypothetical protein